MAAELDLPIGFLAELEFGEFINVHQIRSRRCRPWFRPPRRPRGSEREGRSNATKLHTHKLTAKPMARAHAKHTALHAGKTKARTLTHSKTKATAASTTGWKHHRAV